MRATGRCVYVTALQNVVAACGSLDGFIDQAAASRFSGVWIRLARGPTLDANFHWGGFAAIRDRLQQKGIATWGWHVPFCADQAAAKDEAAKVARWAEAFALGGVLIDAEKTPESPRFRGGTAEAEAYAGALGGALAASGRGLALSSHDQPHLHADLPFSVFLRHAQDNCPQVYYTTADVDARLNRSVHDYQALEAGRDFVDRYKPTGNITIASDVGFSDAATCVTATRTLIERVHSAGYRGYSFWCWDEAPAEIWPLLRDTAV